MTQLDLQKRLEQACNTANKYANAFAESSEKLAQAEAERDALQQQLKDLQDKFYFKQNLTEQVVDLQKQVNALAAANSAKGRCLAFFACVIKTGEPWTETCQREYDAAQLRQPEEKCETCCGRGEIGGFISAESGYEVSLCPDCQPQRFVVKLPVIRIYDTCREPWEVKAYQADEIIAAIKAAGGEIAE